MKVAKRIKSYWSEYKGEFILKQQLKTFDSPRWITENSYLVPTVEGINELLFHLGYRVKEMKQTIYLFEDGPYRFWEVKFLTGRQSMLIRTPDDTAPLVTLQALRRQREEMYLKGMTEDRLQDPIERIIPAQSSIVDSWLAKFGQQHGYRHVWYIDDGEGNMIEAKHEISFQQGLPF